MSSTPSQRTVSVAECTWTICTSFSVRSKQPTVFVVLEIELQGDHGRETEATKLRILAKAPSRRLAATYACESRYRMPLHALNGNGECAL